MHVNLSKLWEAVKDQEAWPAAVHGITKSRTQFSHWAPKPKVTKETNLLHHFTLKSRDTALPTKVRLVKATVFPVIMYGCESWTAKKAECRKIDVFELWCWKRLLRVPWTARRSNQSILKEISPECSLEGLMLKLKLQYFGHLMRRVDSLEKTLMLREKSGGEGDDRGWDGWMASLTQWTWVWVNSGNWWWTGRPGILHLMGSQRVGYDWVTYLNWWLFQTFGEHFMCLPHPKTKPGTEPSFQLS